MLSEFMEPSPARQRAFRLWLEYFVRTEEFDRSLPGAWSPSDRDSWLPRPPHDRASRAFAAKKRAELNAAAQGIATEDSEAARDEVAAMSYALQRRVLEEVAPS